MIEALVPGNVAVSTAYGDAPDVRLFPEERAAVRKAVAKRRREFATVRHCAREALAALGLPPAPIVPGRRGAPRWPAGAVGSMTHCAGFRAAAVAGAADVRTIGIDAEPHERLPERVFRMVARPEEAAMVRELSALRPDTCWDRLLFSAKESVYKAWFPLTGEWLGFLDGSLDFSLDGRFHARLLPPDAPVTEFAGRWGASAGLLATAIVVPR
ncbi:4'-phosphopantetheinyl transferase [Nonomuraea sp. WAC 01424]|uniref:4'-phosphopantetheinyl transferase family protein n=1 Tax=Nonomuraea sp. WAC 01424 TaxID=2203200 RepID=UPI000F7A0138|nr:4'-phosphopantetheinyl transferase superfamily protein [Nonomuraea sp. WAC 01424]RSM99146.1 4'-phosphopantetheinyl transferase [Nonomuraea sp. WAC 01424]